jgi:hypothetical protein
MNHMSAYISSYITPKKKKGGEAGSYPTDWRGFENLFSTIKWAVKVGCACGIFTQTKNLTIAAELFWKEKYNIFLTRKLQKDSLPKRKRKNMMMRCNKSM